MHESLDRLKAIMYGFERFCIGSSAEYSVVCSPKWNYRMSDAWDVIAPTARSNIVLRGMQCTGTNFPFASVDSTDVARNYKTAEVAKMRADHLDGYQCPAKWVRGPTQPSLDYEPTMFGEEESERF